jgi:DNA polymerase III epsilon subunit-like protein
MARKPEYKTMIIIFDTETSGLPKNWNAPTSDADNWPRMVQLAWQLYSDDGRKLAEHNYIIKPDGYTIPEEVAKINGISTERAEKEGVSIDFVLLNFGTALTAARTLVAHNISFDEKIVGAELLRLEMNETHDRLFESERVCTMHGSTKFCAIPGPRGMKWPKLIELHEKLFGVGFEGAHDALVDVQALAKCYFELRRLGIIGA